MKKYYPSAKSTLLGVVLWGGLLLSLGLGIFSAYKNVDTKELITLSSTSLAVILFVGVIWFKTGYFVSKDYLIVKIGPLVVSRIKMSLISNISRSNSILASPANSFNRLAIKSGKKVLVRISPRAEESFLALMIEMNPTIAVDQNLK